MDIKNIAYEKKLSVLISIKKNYDIPDKLLNKIQTILKFGIYKADENYVEFLEELPENLRIELGYHIFKKDMLKIELFDMQINTEQVIAAVGPHLKQLKFNSGEVIFSEGEYANEMYFVKSGSALVVLNEPNSKENIPFFPIGQGGYFGDIDLIYDQRRKFTVIAACETYLLTLESDKIKDFFFKDFRKIGTFLKDRAKIKRKHQIKLYDKAKEILRKK